MSQTEVAAEALVGRQWLVEFEAGDKVSAPFDMVMRVLRVLALDVTLDSAAARRGPRPSDRSTPPTASDILRGYPRPVPRQR